MKVFLICFLFLPLAGVAAEKAATVAMNAKTGAAVRSGEIFTVKDQTVVLVDRENTRIELAPYSVAEFEATGAMKLLRGSALATSRGERTLLTSGAQVDFTGRVVLTYDHKERSTSAFVLEGEARLLNPHQADRSLRLERLRGATLEVGGLLPQLVRQLDFASVESWLKGYAWPEERRQEILKALPQDLSVAKAPVPEHLKEAKLEDYFSSIDTADEFSQPDYYDRKFADPDVVVAEANSKKEAGGKALSPEEAALISLPSTKIDLGFGILGVDEKARELLQASAAKPVPVQKTKGRALASVKPKKKSPAAEDRGADPQVSEVLRRLKSIEPKSPVISQVPQAPVSRGPASVPGAPLIPDPVYDYSENF